MEANATREARSVVTRPTGEHRWTFDPPLSTRLLVMQPTPFCNIACDYCYLAARNDKRLMSLDIVRATASNLKESGLLGPSLGIIWHAGEPLVAPITFYDSAFAILSSEWAADTQLQHSIQTNATLIDERWCALFQHWSVRVGVSLDGPATLHDLHRKTRSGKPTHQLSMKGIEALQRADVPFHIIAVVTSDSLDQADEIMEFFARLGIHDVGFNVDEQEGVHVTSSVAREATRHGAFMRRLIELQQGYGDRLCIRELAVAAQLIRQDLPRVCVSGCAIPDNSQILPFAILSVACTGDYSTFSPELIDQRHPVHGSFIFGNVLRDPIRSMLHNDRFESIFTELLAGVEHCRRTCQFFAYCGGGAPANKLAEHQTLASAETAYCRAVVQAPLLAMLERYEEWVRVTPERPPQPAAAAECHSAISIQD